MPVQLTYPGVYIQELPSGVRAITGVSTSDTAFVDFFARGPVDIAVRIASFADFERQFGGLDARSEASYAIQQYYLNGGSVAWVVRVAAPNVRAATRTLRRSATYYGSGGGGGAADSLTVTAASPGDWSNRLQVAVDYNGTRRDPTTSQPLEFNLVVREVDPVSGQVRATQAYRNLSMDRTSPHFVEGVVRANPEALVFVTAASAGELPEQTGPDVIGDPRPSNFLPLGQSPSGTPGFDGFLPTSSEWRSGAGSQAILGVGKDRGGINALRVIAPYIFNLLCLPGAANLDDAGYRTVLAAAAKLCEDHRAFLLVDIPPTVTTPAAMVNWMNGPARPQTNHAAVYFPRVVVADPLRGNQPREVGPSGTLAGVYARTDANRGVWKAPAGTDSGLRGADLLVRLTDADNGGLNPLGINTLRNFPIFGNVSWGARTLEGADQQASEWKYIPVRRTALFIEESLYEGLKWVVFEPNDEPLWSQIRLNVGAFMQNLFRQGAFQGKTPRDAYFVKCDSETTTQTDINLGIVNILVGFAPLKPAEFVVIKIQQMAGQAQA